ncbi:hypothetical protein [Humidesulfovibrio sp.]|jgi:hypothetical protein|nr:hypothetical protein [Humidesulfovibrio sp.]
MMKKQMINMAASETTYKDGRYLLLPAAAEKIGIPLRTLRAWREKCRFDPDTAGLYAKVGKFVFFDLEEWARLLAKKQQDALEAARAWENRFRLVLFFPAAAIAVAIALTLFRGGGGRF